MRFRTVTFQRSTPGTAIALVLGLFSLTSFAQDPRYVLSMDHASAPAGSSVTIASLLDDPTGEDLVAWTVTVCLDGPAETLAVEDGDTTLTANDGDAPDFSIVEIVPGGGWSVTVILSIELQASLPPGVGYELHRATYALQAPGTVLLEYCDDLGRPAFVTALFESDQQGIVPETKPGMIEVVRAGDPAFVRGDCNTNGRVDLADAIDILNALFDDFVPPCQEACNTDGATAFNTFDATYLLVYLFATGFPPPPPFPVCGVENGADCKSYAPCPNPF